MGYDADLPDAQAWLALAPEERRAQVQSAHEGLVDALHPPSLRRSIHVGLHSTVETMWAQGEVHVVHSIDRLMAQGVRRHAAVHIVMDVLAHRMSALATGVDPWSEERWRSELDAIDPADWIGRRMARDLAD